MDKKELKKMLAGVGIAGLISGVGIVTSPGAASSSGWGAKKSGTVGAVVAEKPAPSGLNEEKDSAGGVDDNATKAQEVIDTKASKPNGSGWSGSK